MELIKVENGIALLDATTSKQIAEWEKAVKLIKEKEDELRKAILNEMESKGIKELETNELSINYVFPYDKETLDSKTFKAERQDIYDEYVKMTPVKSSIRIKVK